MTKLEELQKGYVHYTNEMLDQTIEWWMKGPKLNKDLLLPRLIEEKLNRNEIHYGE